MRRYRNKHKPRLEALESRVMLSVGDSPANVPGNQIDWHSVIHSSGTDEPMVEVYFNDQAVRITGSGHGSLTVDLSQLPASVINLQVSSFDSVSLVGDATLHDLVISNVKDADAGHISLESLSTFGVEHVKIDNAPVDVWLQGPKDVNGLPTIGQRTLLEVGHFSSDPAAMIFGLVDTLGLETMSHVETLPKLFATNILMNFQPEVAPKVAGSELGSAQYITGDFNRYFFATPAERLALERTSVITAQPALIERISTAALLSSPRVQAKLGENLDLSSAKIAISHPLLDSTVGTTRFPTARATEADTDFRPHVNALSSVNLTISPSASANSAVVPEVATAAKHINVSTEAASGPAVPTAGMHIEATHANDAVLGGLSLALARLSDPFVQTVSDLQGRYATFGQIVTAQVAQRIGTEGRPALLVEARATAPVRDRESESLIVVNI